MACCAPVICRPTPPTPTLSALAPLLVPQIKTVAREVGAKDDTIHYMLVSLDDIRAFPYYDLVQSIRAKQEWLGQADWLGASPQGSMALYNPMVMSKVRGGGFWGGCRGGGAAMEGGGGGWAGWGGVSAGIRGKGVLWLRCCAR
jgi:hypothetical protein